MRSPVPISFRDAAVVTSVSLNIPCDTTQLEHEWWKKTLPFRSKLYLFKDLNGSAMLSADLLQGKYVNVFAHIYEPVRNTSSSRQSHGPYSTHACVARYFVDGTPPQKGGAAGYELHHFSSNSASHLQRASQPHLGMLSCSTNRQRDVRVLRHEARRHLVLERVCET